MKNERTSHLCQARLRRTALAAALTVLGTSGAGAMEFDTGNPDVKLRWDNTVRYSAMNRLKSRSPGLSSTQFSSPGVFAGANNLNQDDGDNNFGKGLVSSRIDLLSELDLAVGQFGARVSGAAWYDHVYNGKTDNTTGSANHSPASEFPSETKKIMGRKAELLDAFVSGRFELGGTPVSVRLGRHTLLWGESLFFGANGIAGGMAPLDLVKLLSVSNSQFKEIARPTGKLSGQVQVASNIAVGAYVGYEWEKTRLMPVGAYLSTSDTLGPGAERINAGTTGVFQRNPDVDASDYGQGGVQVRWRVDEIDTDLGFYAIRYHATGPSNIVSTFNGAPPPGAGAASSYRWYFHEGIRAYGMSFAKTLNEWGLAGEASYRQDTPLASSGQAAFPAIGVGSTYNTRSNPPYAVGETAHLQFSWIASLSPNFISKETSFVGEVAWNTRVKVTQNAQMLNPNADKSAFATRMVFSPTYRQAMPGLDVTPTVGVGYTWGKSSALGPVFGPDNGGDVNVGLGAVYLATWFANLSYVHYVGKTGPTLDNRNNAQYTQALKDRNFISLSLRTTF